MPRRKSTLLVEEIQPRILTVRGQRVITDADLAVLYGTTTKAINQTVKRNAGRFPADFMFQLDQAEKTEVVTNCDHLRRLKFSSQLPHAFTEHGAIMAASVLNTARAIEVSVYVVRAFVQLREFVLAHKELARQLTELESRVGEHDEAIRQLLAAIRQLMTPPARPERGKIGFRVTPVD